MASLPPRIPLSVFKRFIFGTRTNVVTSPKFSCPVAGLFVSLSSHHLNTPPLRRKHVQQPSSSIAALSFLHTSAIHHAKKGKKHKAKIDVAVSADEDILDLEELKRDLQKAVDALKQDYTKNLSIRTSQGALDHIIVSTPDGKFPLNQLGQIVIKSNNMMTVNLASFPHATEAAAKAISNSGMNLNPKVDGSIIQVPIPKVTKEHRENLAKSAKGMCDKAKVNMRGIRSKYVSVVKKHKEGTSKDTIFRIEKQIGQVTDTYNQDAEQLLAAKTKELLGK